MYFLSSCDSRPIALCCTAVYSTTSDRQINGGVPLGPANVFQGLIEVEWKPVRSEAGRAWRQSQATQTDDACERIGEYVFLGEDLGPSYDAPKVPEERGFT